MKRKVALYGLLGFSIICLALLAAYKVKGTKSSEENVLLKVALYRTGTTHMTYCFVLSPDGILEALHGARKNNNLKSSKFLYEISEDESVQLTQADFEYLTALVDEIKNNAEMLEKKVTILDGWEMLVYYNDTTYLINSESPLEFFTKLRDKLIEVSPIPVRLGHWD